MENSLHHGGGKLEGILVLTLEPGSCPSLDGLALTLRYRYLSARKRV